MILSNDELKIRLESSDNLINIMTEDKKNPTVKVIHYAGCSGGKTSKPNLTEDERIATGILTRTIGRDIAAETFGVTAQHASDLSHGNNGTNVKEKVDAAIDNVRKTVEEKAAERLLSSLGFLTDDKLSQASAKDISTIATNMSRTMSNMRPKNDDRNNGAKVNVVIHANKQSREEHFDIIEVSA